MQRFRRAASAMALVSLSRSAFLLVRHSATLRFGAGTFRLDLAGSNGCCSGSPPLAAARDTGGTHLRPWRPPHRRARAPHAACPARANTEGSDRPRMASPLAEKNARDLLAVTNPDCDRSRHRPAGGDAAARIVHLNQLWELDSTPADVICADGRRYAIVAAIDIWSRQARVLVVPTSRAAAIAALLRRCILEWGVPEAVRTDEGKDYTSRHVLGVLADLEIEHRPCPPYTPEAKPFVERFLGTLTRDLFATLPGFSGHDVTQAQALRSRKSFAARRGEDDTVIYGAELTAEALQERCDFWCDAVYGRGPIAASAGSRRSPAAPRGHTRRAGSTTSTRWTRCWRSRRAAAGARSARPASASTTPTTSRESSDCWWARRSVPAGTIVRRWRRRGPSSTACTTVRHYFWWMRPTTCATSCSTSFASSGPRQLWPGAGGG